jgi:hypothetical protein
MSAGERKKTVEVGDLVRHVLMDESWLGIVLKIKESEADESQKKAEVYILSEHRVYGKGASDKFSWVDTDWLEVQSKGKI